MRSQSWLGRWQFLFVVKFQEFRVTFVKKKKKERNWGNLLILNMGGNFKNKIHVYITHFYFLNHLVDNLIQLFTTST